jgi:uncharacterized tellurite resistance protein B-like protein
MFVSYLNEEQQSILLALAQSIIQADGVTDEREEELFETIRAQCQAAITPINISMSELHTHFTSHPTKVALLLELIAIAYADEEYHLKEQDLIQEIANGLQISKELLIEIERWVKHHLDSMKDVYRFMEV